MGRGMLRRAPTEPMTSAEQCEASGDSEESSDPLQASCTPGPVRLEPTLAFGAACRFDPVARPELLYRGGEVVAHGALRKVELGRHVAYGRAVRGGPQHVPPALREGVAAFARYGRGQARVHHPLAARHAADGG